VALVVVIVPHVVAAGAAVAAGYCCCQMEALCSFPAHASDQVPPVPVVINASGELPPGEPFWWPWGGSHGLYGDRQLVEWRLHH
jgi:hypothetical protein